MAPEITRIDSTEFSYELEDVGTDEHGFNLVYEPGETTTRKLFALRVHTDEGITGEYVGGNSPGAAQVNMFADYLVGKNPLEREKHWSEIKRALRKYDRMGIGPVDIALWDFAGKYYDAPIHELLGTYRERIPAYASTYHGDEHGGLDSPEAFADFAEEARDRGYTGFKIHGWGGGDASRDLTREIDAVHAVGEAVGDDMNLMHDPACELETFADALKLGRALDEEGFFWYEDPFRDAGISQHAHRKLRQKLDTPILQTEHVRGLEVKSDFAASESTDFLRADPEYDGGITGAMKVARVAEGFGIDTEFHAPGPAQRHCIAATRNANYYEMALVHPDAANTTPPVYAGGYEDQFDTIDADGTVPVPDGPGLGVTYDWDYIEANSTGSLHAYE
ncbi:2-dehydro-3-deoxyphosphogalactonate aldolase (6-phospho-2-dehydro-3-deoxygalactonate aldolase) (2-oxo-3-deoxygalactonate 6-phosphate aldolase) / Galactonate dehydratase [Halarchaeum acidiphilum MH1-52-1]|uniref:glucarate dehydratase n=1 Tax=Halarchaeum acidiphilum MH1-52-1 TaxID=1261545 RepID=U3ADK6_9EURY|nr:mandelate racemase family protein [Halarchaeum acidiphilum]GAD52843.1 2-dehydro-3-deoxyphosphogalactonate aldolase (6-phospho-2-dehydro-3-deoxygalactonate aldolase) (2-oxo-3-deoxygalactonate 6-phosphate aldolase) / Galactonate dehydratase [Halarchaeum acidiphilum MH1-52-1]